MRRGGINCLPVVLTVYLSGERDSKSQLDCGADAGLVLIEVALH